MATPKKIHVPTFKSERSRTAWWGKQLKLASGMSQKQYEQLLDMARGKTQLYNAIHGTTFNHAQVLYNNYVYGPDLSKAQQDILNMEGVGHTHKAGATRLSEASEKRVSEIQKSGIKLFEERMGAFAKESRDRYDRGEKQTALYHRMPFWRVFDKVMNGEMSISEGWQAARVITAKTRQSNSKRVYLY